MKILIVGQHFWPETFRINNVAESLVEAGCSVAVLTGQPNYPGGRIFVDYKARGVGTEHWGEVTIHRVPQVPRGNGSASRLMVNYLSFVLFASVLGPWLLRGKNFDIVLVYAPGPILQSIPGIVIARIKRIKVCTWVQDLWPESLQATKFIRSPLLLRTVALIVRWIYRCNDLLLVQSQAFVQSVKALAGSTPVLYHPNPGEAEKKRSLDSEDCAITFNSGFNILFAGNFGTVQALDTILDAAEKTRADTSLWWVLVGSGRRSEWLRSEVERRGLTQVQLPGRLPSGTMPPVLAGSSALLVTLVRSPIMSRTVPSKVQAYLAAGRPIVAAIDGEGARVVIEAGAGYACPAEDSEALAAAVMKMKSLSDAELNSFGEAARVYHERNFDPEVLARRLIDLLTNAISGVSPALLPNERDS